MSKINSAGYLTTRGRDWWLVRSDGKIREVAYVPLANVIFPKHLLGKRVKFRMIVMEDEE